MPAAAQSPPSPDVEPFLFTLPELEEATQIVRQAFPATPQIAWPLLTERTHAEVWVKHENHLPTSAFKVGVVLTGANIYRPLLARILAQ